MPRNEMTKYSFPDKVNVKGFIKIISDKDSLQGFVDNMKHLNLDERYPEEWIEIFASWMEMNK